MSKRIILYKITNTITEQIYFGVTGRTLAARWRHHCRVDEFKHCYIKRCIAKYGKENFSIESIDSFANYGEAFEAEVKFIAEHKTNISRYPDSNGMNLTDGGEGISGPRPKGFVSPVRRGVCKISKDGYVVEVFESITDAANLYNVTPHAIRSCCVTKDRKSLGFRWIYRDSIDGEVVVGMKVLEHERKPLPSNKPRAKISDNGRENISRAKLGDRNPMKGKASPLRRTINQLTLSGVVVGSFDSVSDAANAVGVSRSCISGALIGRNKSSAGFKWEYKDAPKRKAVSQIVNGCVVATYESVRIASCTTGVQENSIRSAATRCSILAGGFAWKYV
jgi:hypothetical protein